MKNNKLKIPFRAPLNDKDSDSQTFGCRANNPDICKNNSIENICAFVCEDCICKAPSKAWKKQFAKLKEVNSDGTY